MLLHDIKVKIWLRDQWEVGANSIISDVKKAEGLI